MAVVGFVLVTVFDNAFITNLQLVFISKLMNLLFLPEENCSQKGLAFAQFVAADNSHFVLAKLGAVCLLRWPVTHFLYIYYNDFWKSVDWVGLS